MSYLFVWIKNANYLNHQHFSLLYLFMQLPLKLYILEINSSESNTHFKSKENVLLRLL